MYLERAYPAFLTTLVVLFLKNMQDHVVNDWYSYGCYNGSAWWENCRWIYYNMKDHEFKDCNLYDYHDAYYGTEEWKNCEWTDMKVCE